MNKFVLLFYFMISLSSVSLAHEDGHGSDIEGEGPHKGRLTAVIAAEDAEKGRQAMAQAIAEWKKQNSLIQVWIWNLDKTKPLVVKGEVKWILLGGATPQVVKQNLNQPTAYLTYELSEAELKEVKQVEVILNSVDSLDGKKVLTFKL